MAQAKFYTEFVEKDNGWVVLELYSSENPTRKVVEGINFAGVSEQKRHDFLQTYNRQLRNYLFKNKTGNFSMHIVSKHDPRYGQTTKEEIDFWTQEGIVML